MPGDHAGGHAEPVPGVDHRDRGDQLGQLGLVEVLCRPLVHLVRHETVGQDGDGLGQLDRRDAPSPCRSAATPPTR